MGADLRGKPHEVGNSHWGQEATASAGGSLGKAGQVTTQESPGTVLGPCALPCSGVYCLLVPGPDRGSASPGS